MKVVALLLAFVAGALAHAGMLERSRSRRVERRLRTLERRVRGRDVQLRSMSRTFENRLGPLEAAERERGARERRTDTGFLDWAARGGLRG